MVNITGVKIRKMSNEPKLKCIMSVVIEGVFAIHDIKIIEGHNGLFAAMPSRKAGDSYIDIVHPINAEMRKLLEDALLSAYRKEIGLEKVAI